MSDRRTIGNAARTVPHTLRGKQKVHGVFDAAVYDQYIGSIVPHQQVLLRTAVDYLPRSAETILELGCGTGILTEMLQEACPNAEITALDLSAEMLDAARAKPPLKKARFVAGDLRRSWPDKHYDVIITSLCLHHVSKKERIRTGRRALQALAPRGRFICGDIFRAEQDWEEQVLMESWKRSMAGQGTPKDIVAGMVAQRTRRLPELSTIPWFRDELAATGFPRVFVPLSIGFLGLVIGFAAEEE